MKQTRRIPVRETRHYVKYRLADEGTGGEESRDDLIRRKIAMHPPLLAWVARARMLAAR